MMVLVVPITAVCSQIRAPEPTPTSSVAPACYRVKGARRPTHSENITVWQNCAPAIRLPNACSPAIRPGWRVLRQQLTLVASPAFGTSAPCLRMVSSPRVLRQQLTLLGSPPGFAARPRCEWHSHLGRNTVHRTAAKLCTTGAAKLCTAGQGVCTEGAALHRRCCAAFTYDVHTFFFFKHIFSTVGVFWPQLMHRGGVWYKWILYLLQISI